MLQCKTNSQIKSSFGVGFTPCQSSAISVSVLIPRRPGKERWGGVGGGCKDQSNSPSTSSVAVSDKYSHRPMKGLISCWIIDEDNPVQFRKQSQYLRYILFKEGKFVSEFGMRRKEI